MFIVLLAGTNVKTWVISLLYLKLADEYSTEEYTAVIFECIETDNP